MELPLPAWGICEKYEKLLDKTKASSLDSTHGFRQDAAIRQFCMEPAHVGWEFTGDRNERGTLNFMHNW